MEELLQRLEVKIKDIVNQHVNATCLNRQLQHSKLTLTHENHVLLEKQQNMITQLRKLVSMLKTIETAP